MKCLPPYWCCPVEAAMSAASLFPWLPRVGAATSALLYLLRLPQFRPVIHMEPTGLLHQRHQPGEAWQPETRSGPTPTGPCPHRCVALKHILTWAGACCSGRAETRCGPTPTARCLATEAHGQHVPESKCPLLGRVWPDLSWYHKAASL